MPLQIPPSLIIDGTLYALLLFSVITWTIIVFKTWQFSRNSRDNRRYLDAFWEAPNLEAAESLPAQLIRGPKANIAQRGFVWLADLKETGGAALKYRGEPEALLEQALRIQTQYELRTMESGLTLLASIGSTAPFVGLFGTVLGIMNALQDISKSGSASLDVVAGPIGDALIATAIGIAVAVPAVLAYNYFVKRAKQQRVGLENFADGFLHIAFNSDAHARQ
ncbi:MotA/TolQ/ExbB proton channel family protein [Methylomicrobium sp. RS1]|jgi:biopolymer transport protein ExbB|uniref:MotA/TolQ/ExbB proton channel family protein n=1 Tax=Candidatus Methylomicrobium oryzae TaxID=2802053 RepID=UPI0019238AC0|nr:MotA/TolQ/ExbB proton channel family protein [Methylomicrobium sp. RS1]MBL1264903.1 MotA/TolQ/ExbB proton channel family protein [Methylomicrobium sp. RS1]